MQKAEVLTVDAAGTGVAVCTMWEGEEEVRSCDDALPPLTSYRDEEQHEIH